MLKTVVGIWVFALASVVLVACDSSQNPRHLSLESLRRLVCGERLFDPSSNTCGERSVWLEADLGTTAYVTVYGVSDSVEAAGLVHHLKLVKTQAKHSFPIEISIYATAREKGRNPEKNLVVRQKF